MQFFQSWKSSLAPFKGANLKPFVLVTLKAIATTYKTLLRCAWWLLLAYLFGDLVVLGYLPGAIATFIGTKGVVTLSNVLRGSGALFMVIFLAARASVLPKNYAYFFSYWYYLIYIMLFIVMSSFIKQQIVWYLGFGITYYAYCIFIILLGAFFLLFLLDSAGRPLDMLASLWRSLKMIAYNVPGAMAAGIVGFVANLVVMLPIVIIEALVRYLVPMSLGKSFVLVVLDKFGLIVSVPIIACFITNFYIKRIHDQFGLYFEVKERKNI